MKYLSPEVRSWLEKEGGSQFVRHFISLASDSKDRKWRKVSIEIAVQWCILYESGKDGKELNPIIEKLINPLIENPVEEERHQSVNWFWTTMCANSAAYTFASIDNFSVTRALYGIYRTLLPEECDIQPVDNQILIKLKETFSKNGANENEIGYGVRNNGLSSEVIAEPPPGAKGWTEYADQYIVVLCNRHSV